MSVTWQRPQSPLYTKFCAVSRYEGAASIAACGGRWATASTYVLIGVDVGKLECPACRDALDEVPIAKAPRCDCGAPTDDVHSGACQLTRLHRALRELRTAPAIRTAELHTAPRDGVLFEAFDTSDAERDA